MLEELLIENIILIDRAHLSFSSKFNVLTGETGSGKSAIIHALNLLSGQRADLSLLRQGTETGTVQALFSLPSEPDLLQLLDEFGIQVFHDEPLSLKREISVSRRGRAWINDQPVQLETLKKVSSHLFEIIGQHANQKLFSLDFHRYVLDLYGGSLPLATQLQNSWLVEKEKEKELKNLQKSESQRLRDIDRCKLEIDELAAATIEPDEEERLFIEYSRLTHSQELANGSYQILSSLSQNERSLLFLLRAQQRKLEQLQTVDTTLSPLCTQLEAAVKEVEEIAFSLRDYHHALEIDPNKLEEINERLSLLTHLKRKYNRNEEQLPLYLQELKLQLQALETVDERIESLENELNQLKQKNDTLAKSLTERRLQASKSLEKELGHQLHQLNMKDAEIAFHLTPKNRSESGDEQIEIHIKPNQGEKFLPLKDCASGGELSRCLLAIATLLSNKTRLPFLIFDEIDSNVGGTTATTLAQKLLTLAERQQILCITHFPQVAMHADHHIIVSKKEENGRTFSTVKTLPRNDTEQELKRMMGLFVDKIKK